MAISARDKAIAAEALKRLTSYIRKDGKPCRLSPTARLLGLELLGRADKSTGTCWPSEALLAKALGVDERTIRRAKIQLHDAQVLSWRCRGQHLTPLYQLAWETLKAMAASIKERLKAAFTRKTSVPPPEGVKTATQPPAKAKGIEHPEGTFLSANLPQVRIKTIWEGQKGLNAKRPQQALTDQQLDSRASARLWKTLQELAPHYLQAIITHPNAEVFQTEAIKAERYRPGTGIDTLKALLSQEVCA
jgi:hypothetical protein